MTKKQRHKDYKNALKALRRQYKRMTTKSSFPYSVQYSLCWAVPKKALWFYPEIIRFIPEKHDDDPFWWNRKDYTVRETVLLFCIEMTK